MVVLIVCQTLSQGCTITLGAQSEDTMAWTTPTLIEICIGLEINGYLPAEF
jgi:coenzyme PQQ precursor peptide PqqA